jgi:hypothetical protein
LDFFKTFTVLVLISMAISTLIAFIFLLVSARKIRNLQIPPDATFAETLHYTPFLLVLAIDLLDLGLDILAAPLSWVILDRLGLKALRGMATVEALIPGTQIIPTLTLCWITVRILGAERREKIVRVLDSERIT